MNGFSKLILPLAGTLVLAGCAGMELQKAQDMTPQGTAFNTSLYEGYVDLSASEFAEADYEDSDAFAERAISAGSDKLVRPEQIDQRALPDDKVGELKDARRRLTMALSTGSAEQHPAVAANAQVMFDCWMQEQEENFQPNDIARCRGATLAALDKLEVKPVAKAPAPVPKATPATAPMAPETFIVYFAFDSTEMTAASKRVLDNAMRAAKKMDAKDLAVTGHADRAGPEEYNLGLSLRRASAVLDALVARGADPAKVSLAGRGEAEPLAATADGVREPVNRRVEIIVLP
jgi:OOP family OmpA-OmpF porin